jgi:hypothetical protein
MGFVSTDLAWHAADHSGEIGPAETIESQSEQLSVVPRRKFLQVAASIRVEVSEVVLENGVLLQRLMGGRDNTRTSCAKGSLRSRHLSLR